jgi:hypothetical protein
MFYIFGYFVNFGAHRKGTVQGRYIPLFASAVYDRNAWLSAKGLTPINLTSVMIGSYRRAFIVDLLTPPRLR